MNTLLQKGAFGRKSENKTAKAVPQAPGRIFTPLKRGVNEIGLLAAIVSVLSIVLPARAQTPVFNCSCLSTQAVLFTNTCCGVIPDLCPVATNCYSSSVTPSPGYTCSQTP